MKDNIHRLLFRDTTDRFLFRGRHGKEWLYGDLLHDLAGRTYIGTSLGEVDKDTVGQFTGAYEINCGRAEYAKIFEGARVAFFIDNPYDNDMCGMGIVVWIENGFMVQCTTPDNKLRYFRLKDMFSIKLIGTKYTECDTRMEE